MSQMMAVNRAGLSPNKKSLKGGDAPIEARRK